MICPECISGPVADLEKESDCDFHQWFITKAFTLLVPISTF